MSHPAVHGGPSHRGFGRWLVALMATLLLVVSGSGLVAFAQGGAGSSRGPVFVPAEAAGYIEARLDMPEGQSEALGQFLSAFPGFADASSFQTKVDEMFDDVMSEATEGQFTYSDLQAFTTGEVGLAFAGFAEAAMSGEEPEMLVGIAISDRAAAEAFVDQLLAMGGPSEIVQTPYGSTTIASADDMALAVHDEWVLLSPTLEQVQAGIDVLEGNAASLAEDAQFIAAFDRLPTSRLGAAYLDLESFGSIIEMAGGMAAGQAGMALPTEDLLAALPLDMAAYLAAEGDRMTLEAFITPSAQTPAATNGESNLAQRFPSDTQVFIETRELGQQLDTTLGQVFEMMGEEEAAQVAPFEDMLGTDLESFFDFVDDAALGGSLDSDGLWLGIAGEVTDAAAASERVERLLSLVRLFAAGEESGVSIVENTVGDTTVTSILLPVEQMGAGMPVDIGDSVDIAVTEDTLLIGTGEFVSSALAGLPADSLAESPGYLDALGEEVLNTGVMYVNVSALLAGLDPLLSMMVPDWQEIEAYATGIDRIIAVGSADEVLRARMTVIVD